MKIQITLLLFSLLILNNLIAQERLPVTRFEAWWAITHPFVACKAFKLTRLATKETNKLKNDSISDGRFSEGRLDAFRHSYWMALLSQKIDTVKVWKLGVAHEKANYHHYKKNKLEEGILPDSANSAMDYHNNRIGMKIGVHNKQVSTDSLKNIVIKDIIAGRMMIIAMDKNGNYLDCNNKRIEIENWQGKWNIPKCLIPSSLDQNK